MLKTKKKLATKSRAFLCQSFRSKNREPPQHTKPKKINTPSKRTLYINYSPFTLMTGILTFIYSSSIILNWERIFSRPSIAGFKQYSLKSLMLISLILVICGNKSFKKAVAFFLTASKFLTSHFPSTYNSSSIIAL